MIYVGIFCDCLFDLCVYSLQENVLKLFDTAKLEMKKEKKFNEVSVFIGKVNFLWMASSSMY